MDKNKTDVNTAENKSKVSKRDMRMRVIIALCAVLIIGTVVALFFIAGEPDKIREASATTTESSAEETVDSARAEKDALWAEHEALLDLVIEVCWEGNLERVDEMMPPQAWNAAAEYEEISLEEIKVQLIEDAKVNNFAAVNGLSEGYTIRYYLSDLQKTTDSELETYKTDYESFYGIPGDSITEVYIMYVDSVIVNEGERVAEEKIFVSMLIDGKRYISTAYGFFIY